MVTGAVISLLVVAAALVLSGFLSLEERISKLEEESFGVQYEPIEKRPDRLFLEWMYGGED